MVSESIEYSALFASDGATPRKSFAFEELDCEQRAALVPSQLFDHKKNDPAFLFSSDNLLTIKRYERAVGRLPSHREIEANRAFAILQIDVADVKVLFDNLRAHANSWDAIEDGCKQLGAGLQVFAESIITEGAALIAQIKAMDSWNAQVDSKALGGAAFMNGDGKTFREQVDAHLSLIKEDVLHQRSNIQHIRALVDRFGDDISENLKPMTDALFAHVKSHSVPGKLVELQQTLTELDEAIQLKLGQYKTFVGVSFSGLAFGPFGLIVTGGIFGAKAEKVRKEKNELIKQRAQVDRDIKALIGDVGGFETIGEHILDIQFRLVDVSVAAKNLEDVWILLEAYVEHSFRRAERVSTQLELRHFVTSFERVIRPWNNIQDISVQLSRLFNTSLELEGDE
ncbi:hypothetical protein E6B08_06125 [Pseudomonas putida]|uniref:Alpha-xenorhabdolysin family binary toxin subunit A n=1 Tax=Pseudomonas putida TaxID=303 RepID=A0A4D6X686_PSEPU|nr:alpha-xenorhabdolysin family binary toxin subunit A [Pseudomonas putida]QCI11012.1 hypothetical protein E6B08_06125 [Pseudomonas putida]